MLNLIYGTMGSGKSLELLSLLDKLKQSQLKYATVSLNRKGYIESRFFNLKEKADFNEITVNLAEYDYILVDECQFITEDELEILHHLSNENKNIYCYGLLTDFKGNLFDGMSKLIPLADNLKEIHNICSNCGKVKAIHHLKTDLMCEDNLNKEIYKSVCYSCFKKGVNNA